MTMECLAAFITGVVLSPGLNLLSSLIPFQLGAWKVTVNNYPGLSIAVLFFVMQVGWSLCYYSNSIFRGGWASRVELRGVELRGLSFEGWASGVELRGLSFGGWASGVELRGVELRIFFRDPKDMLKFPERFSKMWFLRYVRIPENSRGLLKRFLRILEGS